MKWSYFYEGSGDYLINDENGEEIASVSRPDAHFMHTGKGSDINLANARLIASAPELLEALKLIVGWHKYQTPAIDIVLDSCRVAIAKAEGGE